MKGYRPPRPSGTSPEARFMQWAWDTLTQILGAGSTSTVKVDWTTKGPRFHAAAQKGGASDLSVAVFQAATGLTGWLQQDYLLAYKVGSDGTADTGTTYKIAKPWRTRGSVASEVIGGITYSYAADTAGTTRTVTWTYSGTGYSEAQVIVPPWVASENIVAMKFDYTGVTVDGADVGWMAIQDGSKAWMKRNA